MIRMAWAIIVSAYTDSEDVVFGITVNGRNAAVLGIEQLTGPTIATIPLRVHVRPDESVSAALSMLQQKTTDVIPFQQTGLQNIRKFDENTTAACNFQCHLGVQASPKANDPKIYSNMSTKHEDYRAFANYALVITAQDILIATSFDEEVVKSEEVHRMLQQFDAVLRQISDAKCMDHQLKALDLVCPQDIERLATWNAVFPPSRDDCLHELVSRHSSRRGDAPAISSWDGDMTFKELEKSSCSLANYLISSGIKQGSSVPLCFERSRWVIVAILAVLRIGAACICLDPAHPKARIQEILQRTNANFALVSPDTAHTMAGINITIVVVPIIDTQTINISSQEPSIQTEPDDIAFIVFTSGSTGIPKGVLLQHSNLATSILNYSNEMEINQNTRALHFASYAFDASIYEIFGTLINGGCLCIPSEYDRMNHIELFINEYGVNWAFLTPSFITLMRPESIPSVKTIVLGGEAVTRENVRIWSSKVTLVNGYGPAEATVCAVGKIPESNWKHGTIGKISGGLGWITMPNDCSRLAPVGAIGELLIEGHVVSRGYLNDEKSTTSSYVTDLPWRYLFPDWSSHNRFYRSGDLFQYNIDGTIRYIGRRDTQIKLRGQRIELSEIEENLKQVFPGADVIAEVVADTLHQAPLVRDMFSAPDKDFLEQVSVAITKLRQKIPDYMVPSVFLQVPRIPRTSSDKADRKRLREQAAALSRQDVQSATSFAPIQREIVTASERALQKLWAEVFKIAEGQIGAEDDFFLLEGDSISAMKLVSLARQRGLRLLSSWIFAHPVLRDLATFIEDLTVDEWIEYIPGSLLDIADLESFAIAKLRIAPALVKGSNILDILPTTEFQSRLLKAGNVTYSCLHLHKIMTPERADAACRALLRKHSILRTVFASYNSQIIQVILGDLDFELTSLSCNGDFTNFCKTICSQDSDLFVSYGIPPFQPFLITSESEQVLILRMTHTQYDGISLPMIWEDLVSACNGNELPAPSLSFGRYLQFRKAQNTKETFNFWREYLRESQMTNSSPMDILPQIKPKESVRVKVLKDMPIPCVPNGSTLTTLVRAAWSLVLAKKTQRNDIVFGNIINGRTDIPLKDIETLSGPTVTISPVRATIQRESTIKDFLDYIQLQFTRTIPFANVDPRDIVRESTSWPSDTEFGSILTHQNVKEGVTFEVDGAKVEWELLDFGVPTDFHVVTWVKDGRFWVHMSGPNWKLRQHAVEEMAGQLCESICRFSSPSTLIGDVLVLSD